MKAKNSLAVDMEKASLVEFLTPKVAKAAEKALASLRQFIDTSGADTAGAYSAYEAIQKVASELDVEFFR